MDFHIPIHLRLIRYKDLKRKVTRHKIWEADNYATLIESWISYIQTVKSISFNEFSLNVFNGKLEEVCPKSYRKFFKV